MFANQNRVKRWKGKMCSSIKANTYVGECNENLKGQIEHAQCWLTFGIFFMKLMCVTHDMILYILGPIKRQT